MTNARNTAASVRARLLNKARVNRQDFNLLLGRYALERILYRLSRSTYRGHFLLKGSLLFDLWFDMPHRPTHDADLLGFTQAEVPHLIKVFQEICAIACDDGVLFQPGTVRAAKIRKEANYAGIRVNLLGLLDGARCPVQIDIGFGDAVVPGPEEAQYPVILDEMPAPQLHVYPQYTVIAEKLEAIVSLGMGNTRMKDYFDLWVLVQHAEIDGAILTQAVHATFGRRGTPIPGGTPLGLADEFAQDRRKRQQWEAFLRKNELPQMPLDEIVGAIRPALLAAMHA
ncbi:nucleotidyl transferase AbiEii/AbiGii toxin family protein [Pigmentiphaga sp. H8]|uniref:nucleotidyl transferase AbiEii/AbiGii toxin family protein n=1 Tax=unclassified Pigmentiphaga TaxID=2626614 RepID=UPI000F592578|nr:nucleotidyl transferase AbiEii/AbiGii toxin family protein [Pigmentiphaga sp. H8]AZG06566.1 nucleotidyl transferase AbiEii/AbiGii toxin family protein [Pigmentiphaga sp. H8]